MSRHAARDDFDAISYDQAMRGIDMRGLEAHARDRADRGRVSARIVALAFDAAHAMAGEHAVDLSKEDESNLVLRNEIEITRLAEERRTVTDLLRAITVSGLAAAGERYPLFKEKLDGEGLDGGLATDRALVSRRRAIGWCLQAAPLPFVLGALAGDAKPPRLAATVGGAGVSAAVGTGLRISATEIERYNRLFAQVDKRYLEANPSAMLTR